MSILDMINKDIEKSLCNTCSNKAMCIFALDGIVHQCKDYNKMEKYYYICLREINGEYEYTHKVLSVLTKKRSKKTLYNYIDKHITSNWYDTEPDKMENAYFYNCGNVAVKCLICEEIPEEHFNILTNYLNVIHTET